MRDRMKSITKLIVLLALLFLVLFGAFLFIGSRYISSNLLQANEATAIDIALLVKNNFHITDEEVAYMKSLTFNEMEVDPINYRLMDIGNGVKLNASVENVYIVTPLDDSEIRYCENDAEAALIGYNVGTELNAIWLLNGNINEDGKFQVAHREDICRYTVLTESQQKVIDDRQPYSDFSADIWGDFITGYVPIYTSEGNFAGILGIDITPDRYQSAAQSMILFLTISFAIITVILAVLFIVFYLKYTKIKEEQIYFDFYSRMSHDMRTPMNAIIGMAVISKDETDIDVIRHNLEMIESSGSYMLRLINDTLDIQRIKAGKMSISPKLCNCRRVIDGLVEMAAPAAEQKDIVLQVVNHGVKLDCYAYLDEIRLKQIFMNIMSNAIKFTPQGGNVTFIMECLGVDGDVEHNKFQISDSGIGMSEKFIATKLYKPFEQEYNSTTAQYDGSGLGLSITKQLVELMGGRIEVESRLGEGTTFSVYLDIRKVENYPIEDRPSEVLNSDNNIEDVLIGKHILICEDHPLNAEIAKALLEKKGCIIEIAENGQNGLDTFLHSEVGFFDAVLMDIRMPVMDGLEATRRIRALSRSDAQTIPIVAMTANAYAEDIIQTEKAGMNAHLAKPIDPKALFKELANQISSRIE